MISIISTILGFIVVFAYRPWVIENSINDSNLHEFLPSFFYTLGFSLFGAWLMAKNPIGIIVSISCGSLVYEVEQIWSHRIFDYMDVIAIIIGFIVAVAIVKLTNITQFSTSHN